MPSVLSRGKRLTAALLVTLLHLYPNQITAAAEEQNTGNTGIDTEESCQRLDSDGTCLSSAVANDAKEEPYAQQNLLKDNNESCEEWARETNRCLVNRTTMLGLCPESCERIAGVSVDTLTEEQILEDAARGYAYVVTETSSPEADDGAEKDEREPPCVDLEDECVEWATENEQCLENFEYMKENCPKACHICFAEGTTVANFGVEQMIDYNGIEETNQAIADNIKATLEYFTERVYIEERFEHLRRGCFNHDKKCSYYAASGWCDSEDVRWMQENCSPACQSCMTREYWYECGSTPDMQDALKPGGIKKMFEGIIDAYPRDKITVLSYPDSRKEFIRERNNLLVVDPNQQAVDTSPYPSFDEYIKEESRDWIGALDHEKPWVLTLDDFLTDEECEFLIAQGHEIGFDMSTKVDSLSDDGMENNDGIVDEGRTSRNTFCNDECYDHPTTQKIMERMASLTGLPKRNSESLQLLKYEIGEHYQEHHDAVNYWSDIYCGNRILTIFLYLNEPEEGGETRLNALNLDVTPKKGMALLWPSVRDDNLAYLDDWAWHQALPVKKGRKYGANAWFHLRNYWEYETDYECM